ncbi:MAG TPA: nucleotidyl transferase AbiEii/AbiGii toxin family protein [Parafilimonas sp.]|nr:nucleotidyl transferase AbiEii/AbiGii toxin family protein [Parafilimonas sp.]
MLQQNATPPVALEILKTICGINDLNSFGLGGGTNLALRMGHRLSVDLDLFTNTPFNTGSIFHVIAKRFSSSELLFEQNQTMMFSIDDIKVDFILYPFPWLKPFDTIEGIRLLSIEDIIPMKLQAISNRNAKKDYWDIVALFKTYPLDEMLKVFSSKFPQVDIGYIIHSLTDFEIADSEPDPDTSYGITWNSIKTSLSEAVSAYTKRDLENIN